MYRTFKRVIHYIHQKLLHHHTTLSIIAGLMIFSSLSYHLPIHIKDGNFQYLSDIIHKLSETLGNRTFDLLSILIGVWLTFVIVMFFMSKAVMTEMEDFLGIKQRRRYVNVLFMNLVADCRSVQKKFNSKVHSLRSLDNICSEFQRSIEHFKAGADIIVTPTIEEFFSDPDEYFYIVEQAKSAADGNR